MCDWISKWVSDDLGCEGCEDERKRKKERMVSNISDDDDLKRW